MRPFFSSTLMTDQALVPPRSFHASPCQVSLPNSPGRGTGRQFVLFVGELVSQTSAQVEHAILPELRVRLPGHGVDREKAAMEIAEKNALLVSVLPERHAAADEEVGAHRAVNFGIELPALLAGFGVERD